MARSTPWPEKMDTWQDHMPARAADPSARAGASGGNSSMSGARAACQRALGARRRPATRAGARSARGSDAAGVHRAPHVGVALRVLADRRAGALDGLARPPLTRLL